MKSINDYAHRVNESSENKFNPNLKSHAKCYNNLLKWYDKCIDGPMDRDEAISCMEYAIEQWKNGNFDDI